MAQDAVGRVGRFVVPAFGVDGIGAEELHVALVELPANGVDHAAVFVLEEAALGGREDQEGQAGVPEDEEVHAPAERGAVPAVEVALHIYCTGTNSKWWARG